MQKARARGDAAKRAPASRRAIDYRLAKPIGTDRFAETSGRGGGGGTSSPRRHRGGGGAPAASRRRRDAPAPRRVEKYKRKIAGWQAQLADEVGPGEKQRRVAGRSPEDGSRHANRPWTRDGRRRVAAEDGGGRRHGAAAATRIVRGRRASMDQCGAHTSGGHAGEDGLPAGWIKKESLPVSRSKSGRLDAVPC